MTAMTNFDFKPNSYLKDEDVIALPALFCRMCGAQWGVMLLRQLSGDNKIILSGCINIGLCQSMINCPNCMKYNGKVIEI